MVTNLYIHVPTHLVKSFQIDIPYKNLGKTVQIDL